MLLSLSPGSSDSCVQDMHLSFSRQIIVRVLRVIGDQQRKKGTQREQGKLERIKLLCPCYLSTNLFLAQTYKDNQLSINQSVRQRHKKDTRFNSSL